MRTLTAAPHHPVSQSRIISWVESFVRDLRFTLRSLRRRPGFTLVVVLSLALGIGANTAIFSVVDAVLLRPLPIPNPGQLAVIDVAASRYSRFGAASYLDLQDFRQRSRAFESLAIASSVSAGMSSGQGEPEVVYGMMVSSGFFHTLQIQPALGRDFRADEDEVPGKYPVVILSHALWGRAFANDPGIIGKQVKLNGRSFTIIGVTPRSFTGPNLFSRPDMYVPTMMAEGLTTDGNAIFTHRGWREFEMSGRLKPGVTLAQAQAEMDGIMRDLEKAYPETNRDAVAYVRWEMKRRFEFGFLFPAILMGLVIMVLLIACANVASLLMARATTRMKEISTQLAVGASRGILIRQLLTESTVLAFLGGGAGILLAFASIRMFETMLPIQNGPGGPDFHLDLRVLSVAVAASTLSVFLCGLAPAFSTVKEAMMRVTSNVRAGAAENGAYGALTRRVLIAGQIALSTMLLIAGGLFLKSFIKAQNTDLGFNPDNVLLVQIDPTLRGYTVDQAVVFQERLLQQVTALPGVRSASIASSVPFMSGASWDVSIEGFTGTGGEKFIDTATNQVAPGYFKTMQISLLRGREFTDHDGKNGPLAAIVNETLARRYIVKEGDLEQAIGKTISLRDHAGIPIIGVVKDSNYGNIGTPPQPVFYLSYAQMGRPMASLHVRTLGDPGAMTAGVRDVMKRLDPDVTPVSVTPFRTVISSSGLFLPRIAALLGGSFGVVALSLAVIGLYGVVAFMVGRRTQEIGVRMALGAQRGQILRMVLVNGLSLAAIGVAAGTVASFFATPLMRGILLDVNPRDPVIFVAIVAALGAATVAASWIPARRATRVDPLVALRYE